MNFSLYVALRYLKSGSRTSAINWITWLSSIGIILGCMSLFVVLSVFSGLRDYSMSFVNDFDPDYKILPKSGKTFEVNPKDLQSLSNLKEIDALSQTIEDRVVFQFNNKDLVAYIKGVDSSYYKVNNLYDYIEIGDWLDSNSQEAVVGYGIADKLGLGISSVNQIFEAKAIKPGSGSVNMFADNFIVESLLPVGIYFINEELNNQFIFTDLNVAQRLLSLNENQVYSIDIKTSFKISQKQLEHNIQKIIGDHVIIKNRAELNETLLRMLNTENLMLYLIFVLVLSLVLFTLIGTLLMMIIDKKQDLITLSSFGYQITQLKRIFWFLGFLISIIGGLIGLILGFIIVWIQWEFQPIMINDQMAYPVKIEWQNFVIVILTIAVLGGISSMIASQKVSSKILKKNN